MLIDTESRAKSSLQQTSLVPRYVKDLDSPDLSSKKFSKTKCSQLLQSSLIIDYKNQVLILLFFLA